MKSLIWSDRAVDDLQGIRRYWVARDPHLVVALDDELDATTKFLLENPRAGSPTGRSRRRKWRVGRTPFLIFYTVRADNVHIGRVRHERENWLRSH